jgi:hypothetical protein
MGGGRSRAFYYARGGRARGRAGGGYARNVAGARRSFAQLPSHPTTFASPSSSSSSSSSSFCFKVVT